MPDLPDEIKAALVAIAFADVDDLDELGERVGADKFRAMKILSEVRRPHA